MEYKDGKPDGSFSSFYDVGSNMDKGNFKNGKKDGKWESYDRKGKVYKVAFFKDGVLQK
jgi:antitoxin component YwqK of YwqJK toxin-antitoxin module